MGCRRPKWLVAPVPATAPATVAVLGRSLRPLAPTVQRHPSLPICGAPDTVCAAARTPRIFQYFFQFKVFLSRSPKLW